MEFRITDTRMSKWKKAGTVFWWTTQSGTTTGALTLTYRTSLTAMATAHTDQSTETAILQQYIIPGRHKASAANHFPSFS